MLISSWRAASGRLPQRQQAKVLAIVALLHCFFEDLCTSKPIGGTSDQRRVIWMGNDTWAQTGGDPLEVIWKYEKFTLATQPAG